MTKQEVNVGNEMVKAGCSIFALVFFVIPLLIFCVVVLYAIATS